eukprot:8710048-Lingulodinium_polyedra.AAC.1
MLVGPALRSASGSSAQRPSHAAAQTTPAHAACRAGGPAAAATNRPTRRVRGVGAGQACAGPTGAGPSPGHGGEAH